MKYLFMVQVNVFFYPSVISLSGSKDQNKAFNMSDSAVLLNLEGEDNHNQRLKELSFVHTNERKNILFDCTPNSKS